MAVRPRGNSWQADVSRPGQPRLRHTFTTRDEAAAWELEAKAAILRGMEPPVPAAATVEGPLKRRTSGGPETWAAAFDRTYDKFWKDSSWGKRTIHLSRQIEDHFGRGVFLHHIDTDALDGLVREMEDEGYADQTINHTLAVLSKVFKHALERGAVAKAPVIHRKKTLNGRTRYLTDAEEATILSLLRQWEKHEAADVVTVMLDTAFRNSEVWSLTPRHVDLKTGLLSLWATKTNQPRSIPMTARVRAIIERRMAGLGPKDPLFPFDNFWLRNAWAKVRSVMGMMDDPHFVPYVCRHTCITRLVQKGIPLATVSRWAGHKSIQMTMRYSQFAPQDLDGARAVLDEGNESEVERLRRELAELKARMGVAA